MSDSTPAPEDRLTIDVDDASDPARIVLAGEVDPHTAPLLQTTIDDLLDGNDATALTLDFTAVTFVDSAGLRVIADTHRRLDDAGGGLRLQSPSRALQRLLTVTGLGDHLDVV